MPKARYTRDKERGGYRYNFRQANGKYTTLRAATIPEMDALIRQRTKERDDAILNPAKLTVREVADMWLPTALDGRSSASQYSTRCSVRRVLDAIGDKPVRKVLPADIDRLILAAPPSVSSRRNTLSAARRIFSYAVENGYCERNPAENKKAGGRKPPEEVPLTAQQQEVLIAAAKEHGIELFVLLCLRAGLRAGEALGLRWKSVDMESGTLTVSGVIHAVDGRQRYEAVTKSEAGKRTIPMPKDLCRALQDERERNPVSAFVISDRHGSYLTPSWVRGRWMRMNLPFACHPHQLRHTYITQLCAKSAEVGLDIRTIQYLAGHSTPSITMKIYSHVQAERSDDTARKVHAALD